METMLFVGVFIFCIGLEISRSEESQCVSNHECVCGDSYIKCDCSGGDAILMPFLTNHEPVTIVVENCANVKTSHGVFSFMHITSLEFRNIDKLDIGSFAIAKTRSISNVVIENVQELTFHEFSFTGLDGTNSVEIRNTTARFAEFSVIGRDIDSFVVEDSVLLFHILGLVVVNSTDIAIKSSIIDATNNSVVMHRVQSFDISSSNFTPTITRMFNIGEMETFSVTKCLFDALSFGVFSVEVDNFFFEGNRVTHSVTDSFIYLNATKSATFSDNVFESLEEDSVFPNPSNVYTDSDRQNVFSRNGFHCDCSLSWMFNNSEVYSPLIENSFCVNYAKLPLLKLLPKIYSCNSKGIDNGAVSFDRLTNGNSSATMTGIFRTQICLLIILITVSILCHYS